MISYSSKLVNPEIKKERPISLLNLLHPQLTPEILQE